MTMKLSLKLMIAVTLCALNLSVGWAQRQYPVRQACRRMWCGCAKSIVRWI